MDNTRSGTTSCWELISVSFSPLHHLQPTASSIKSEKWTERCWKGNIFWFHSTPAYSEGWVYSTSVTYRLTVHCFLLWLMFLRRWIVWEHTMYQDLLVHSSRLPRSVWRPRAVDKRWMLCKISVMFLPRLTWPHEKPAHVGWWMIGKIMRSVYTAPALTEVKHQYQVSSLLLSVGLCVCVRGKAANVLHLLHI